MSNQQTVYIVLTHTGTLFTRFIRCFTGDPFNHASIAFDHELREVYSFGRKMPHNPFVGGFVREDLRGGLFARDRFPTSCAIYECDVSENVYQLIRQRIRHLDEHRDQYTYNLLGLIGVLLNKKWDRKNKYFCSQFVASLFEYAGAPLVDKPSSFVTPGDIGRSPHLRQIYVGPLQQYLAMLDYGVVPAPYYLLPGPFRRTSA